MQESGRLQDGANQKPSYSLRTLCRALEYCRTALPVYGMQKALLDGLKMAFMTQLNLECAHIILALINLHVTGNAKAPKVRAEALALPCNASVKHQTWGSLLASFSMFHVTQDCHADRQECPSALMYDASYSHHTQCRSTQACILMVFSSSCSSPLEVPALLNGHDSHSQQCFKA